MNRQALTAFCESRLPDTLDFLRRMVEINSFTGNPEGVNRLAALIAQHFAPFGFEPTLVDAANPQHGRHLVLHRELIPGAPTVALISHLDTVFTEEEERRNNFHWRPEGNRIYGPGTNDIKGGTALMHLVLSTLRELRENVFSQTNWVLLFNACEEVISSDFRDVCRDHLPQGTRACLIFEADGGEGDDFALVVARKGRATFDIEVEGRGAHAGGQHQRGANAVVQLAQIVQELHRLTDYEAGLTVNIGSISGGTVVNRVPHEARAALEIRAFTPLVYDRAKQEILAWNGEGTVRSAEGDQPCRVKVHLRDESSPWPRNVQTDALCSVWHHAAESLGLHLKSEERGGLSDGNGLWDLFPTLDGLGPRGDDCHCSEQSVDGSKQQEWVDVTSFAPKAVLNCCAIERLLASPEPLS